MENRVPQPVEVDRASRGSRSFNGSSLLSSSRSLTIRQRYKRLKRQMRDAVEAAKFPSWEKTSRMHWSPISLQTWTLDSSFRRFLLRLVSWQVFQWFFTLAIIANVVTLAMVSPDDRSIHSEVYLIAMSVMSSGFSKAWIRDDPSRTQLVPRQPLLHRHLHIRSLA
jgi:hypothetical protein